MSYEFLTSHANSDLSVFLTKKTASSDKPRFYFAIMMCAQHRALALQKVHKLMSQALYQRPKTILRMQTDLGVKSKQVFLEVCHTIGRAHSNLEDFVPTDEAGKPAVQQHCLIA